MDPAPRLKIGFAGLGAMGYGMASVLVRAGHDVIGFDIHQPSLERFRAAGGGTSCSAREAARRSDFFLCVVATPQQAHSLLFEGKDNVVQGMNFSASPAVSRLRPLTL